jgi:hypothetical protein
LALWKKTAAGVIVLALIGIGGYFVFSQAGAGRVGGDGGGSLGGISTRTLVTLSVIGGSAFITGFGFRDVIGRAVAARQRSRLKAAQKASQVRR